MHTIMHIITIITITNKDHQRKIEYISETKGNVIIIRRVGVSDRI
jgi:hypothetical protein